MCECSVGSGDVMFVYLSIYLCVVKKCSLNCIGGFFSIFFFNFVRFFLIARQTFNESAHII